MGLLGDTTELLIMIYAVLVTMVLFFTAWQRRQEERTRRLDRTPIDSNHDSSTLEQQPPIEGTGDKTR